MKYLLLLLITFYSFSSFSQTKQETNKWLKMKIESYGSGLMSFYKVDTIDCGLIIKEYITSEDTIPCNIFTIKFAGLDFDKFTKDVNMLGTLKINMVGSVKFKNDLLESTGNLQLRFTPANTNQFYDSLIKALKHQKQLCGGVKSDLF